MIDWIEFYAVSAIFQSCNGGDYKLNVSLAALTSLLFIETQRNGLLRAKEVVILDTGHHLMSHPTDMTTNELLLHDKWPRGSSLGQTFQPFTGKSDREGSETLCLALQGRIIIVNGTKTMNNQSFNRAQQSSGAGRPIERYNSFLIYLH